MSTRHHETLCEPSERKQTYDAFINVASIDDGCEQLPNGMYVAKGGRFDKRSFFNEINARTELGLRATAQALKELGILKIASYSDAYTTIIHPQAVLFLETYSEEHAREAFRHTPPGIHQYYWEGPPGAIQEVREYLERHRLTREAGQLPPPMIDRHIGQFIPGESLDTGNTA